MNNYTPPKSFVKWSSVHKKMQEGIQKALKEVNDRLYEHIKETGHKRFSPEEYRYLPKSNIMRIERRCFDCAGYKLPQEAEEILEIKDS